MKIGKIGCVLVAGLAAAWLAGCAAIEVTSNPSGARVEFGTVKLGPQTTNFVTPVRLQDSSSGPYYRVVWPDGTASPWAAADAVFGRPQLHFEKGDPLNVTDPSRVAANPNYIAPLDSPMPDRLSFNDPPKVPEAQASPLMRSTFAEKMAPAGEMAPAPSGEESK